MNINIKNTTRIVQLAVILIMLFAQSNYIFISYAETKHDSKKNILDKVIMVSKQLEYGNAPNFMTVEAIRELGYGSCEDYSFILANELLDLGVPNRQIGFSTFDGRDHAMLEVRYDQKWVLADPTIGILYNYGFTEILGNPQLADQYYGEPLENRGGYFGSDFFKDVKYVSHPKLLEFTEIPNSLFTVNVNYEQPESDIKREFMIEQETVIKINWDNTIDVNLLELNLSNTDAYIKILDRDDKTMLFPSNDYYSIYVNDVERRNGEIQLMVTPRKATLLVVNLSLLAKRENLEKKIKYDSPLATYISFTDGPVKVDYIKLISGDDQLYSVNIGDPTEEKRSNSFVYANDYFGFDLPSNGWGEIEKEEDINYRVAQFYENSIYKHSVIMIRPDVNLLKKANKAILKIRYKNSNKGSENPSLLSIYDPEEQVYRKLASLESSETWTEKDIEVDVNLLKKTLGFNYFTSTKK